MESLAITIPQASIESFFQRMRHGYLHAQLFGVNYAIDADFRIVGNTFFAYKNDVQLFSACAYRVRRVKMVCLPDEDVVHVYAD